MKILFWVDGFWPRLGGSETLGFQWVQNFQNRGHQCLVLAQRDFSSWQEEESYCGISIRRFDFNSFIHKKELKRARDYLEKISRQFKPDRIVLNTLTEGSALAFLFFREIFQAPAIAIVHAPHYGEKAPSLIEKIGALVDFICCVSMWAFQTMKRYFPLLQHKLRLIYNGSPLPQLHPSPLPISPPVLLLLGRFSSEKGFDIAIKAFSLLKKEGSQALLLLAGEGPERPYLEHLVEKLKLKSFCRFTGRLEKEEVPFILNQATLVLVPSLVEAFGLVALEAMLMGRPIIASAVGGLQELVINQETGLLVPPQNPMALCQALQELLKEPKKMIQMGLQGRARALQNYSLEEKLDQYENLLKEQNFLRRLE